MLSVKRTHLPHDLIYILPLFTAFPALHRWKKSFFISLYFITGSTVRYFTALRWNGLLYMCRLYDIICHHHRIALRVSRCDHTGGRGSTRWRRYRLSMYATNRSLDKVKKATKAAIRAKHDVSIAWNAVGRVLQRAKKALDAACNLWAASEIQGSYTGYWSSNSSRISMIPSFRVMKLPPVNIDTIQPAMSDVS